MKKLLLVLIIITINNCYSQTVSSLAYEGFDYTINTVIGNKDGGAGWDGPWTVQNNSMNFPGYQVQSGSLSYGSILKNGHKLIGGDAYQTVGRLLDRSSTGAFKDMLNGNRIGKPGDTLFFGAIVQSNTNEFSLGFGSYLSPGHSSANDGYSFTIKNNVWGIDDGIGNFYPSTKNYVQGEILLLVYKLSFYNDVNNNNTLKFDVFINPPTSTMPPAIANVSAIRNNTPSIAQVRIYFNAGSGNGAIDEIRIGKTFESVAPTNLTNYNYGPIAVFSVSPSTGTAPLIINCNASLSTDDKGIVKYYWNFNDASPVDSSSGAIVNHSYTSLGKHNICLTVKDASGLTSKKCKDVFVTDADGTFPCKGYVSLISFAGCNNAATGRLQFNNEGSGSTARLYNSNNVEMAGNSSGSTVTFSGLPAGNFILSFTGTDGCSSDIKLTVPIDSSTCAGWQPSLCNMQFGINAMGSTNYWGQERPFKNFAIGASKINPVPISGGSLDMSEMPVDSSGYPLSIPFNSSKGSAIAQSMITADGKMPPGNYVLLFDGSGTITIVLPGSNVTSSSGRLEFTIPYFKPEYTYNPPWGCDKIFGSNIWYKIMKSQQGNYVRNIRIVRAADEFTNLKLEPFYEKFVERLKPFRSIRFMDAFGTNSSTIKSWSDRSTTTTYTQTGNNTGLPYEYGIELCNISDSDPWICIPHMADDDYIQKFAELVKNNLKPNLKIYLEYSNELWNFSQGNWLKGQVPVNVSLEEAVAQKSLNLFKIWRKVFGADSLRIQRVIGGWTYVPEYGAKILAHMNGQYDYLSPSYYFFYSSPCSNSFDANSTIDDLINCSLQEWRSTTFSRIKQNARNSLSYGGKGVIFYEGGPHMLSTAGSGVCATFQDTLYAMQTSRQMYDHYQEVIDSLKTLPGHKLAMAYSSVGKQEIKWGSWGHLSDLDDVVPGPKWQVLLDNIKSSCYDISTSVLKSETKNTEIKIYPNPAINSLIIEGANVGSKIMMFDITGRLILTKQKSSDSNEEIDLSNYSQGVYLIRIADEANVFFNRIVKQ